MSKPTRARAILVAGVSAMALGLSAGIAHADQTPDGGPSSTIEEVIVTAQRKAESAQTVPIAITAFSPEALEAQKIEGGPDLMKGIPNTSFTKTNFSGYNLTIRGIGTQAISVTTDPGVSVNYNGTAFIRNRLFEQEFFDVERVEVLRGPQGTLYGRNATAGAVNVITARPTDAFEGELKGEVGNFNSRRMSGFINLPLGESGLALRLAGASTQRDGYAHNDTTGNDIDGRDLYSTRATLEYSPSDAFRADLVWEHFEENDNRARSTKQLCARDDGPTSLGALGPIDVLASAAMSQGCRNVSLYSDAAYGTPNGLSIPFVYAGATGLAVLGNTGSSGGWATVPLLTATDPYGGMTQSHDLRRIASRFDPRYRAKSDIIELNFDFDITPNLTLTSQTAYNEDHYFSQQDYSRFETVSGVFNDSTGLFEDFADSVPAQNITPGGVYCDPQLGCADTIMGVDQSEATSRQISQEIRLQSAFDGPVNFSVGANYLQYKTLEDYFVFFNVITALAQTNGSVGNNSADVTWCNNPALPPGPITPDGTSGCIYIDPHPLSEIDGLGHNYFRSKNPYRVESKAIFGELYYNFSPTMKLTAGIRYTDDRKTFTPAPSQTLLSSSMWTGGTVDGGYPSKPDIKQQWGAVTGRLGIDWTPELSFTDRTLVYAFYNRGYKGGGANPPAVGFTDVPLWPGGPVYIQPLSYPATFDPEYVNAFEIGTKNSLIGGSLILNGAAFYYDYKDYQVSQIQDRTAINENFDAKVWGLELESIWQATDNLRFNLNLGYQDSSIADGSQSIDVMDRTQGNDDYTVFKAFPLVPSNCVVLKSYVESFIAAYRSMGSPDATNLPLVCPGTVLHDYGGLPVTPDPSYYPNEGRGFYADISGHSLPNAPHWTQTLGVEYRRQFGDSWEATLRVDAYHQSQSWARVYEDAIDKLHGWYNVNLRLTVANPDEGLILEAYVKNLLDATPITGAFINSDDSALTTNVFTLDPRLIGVSVRKSF